ncbi:hypothetical protein FI667_g17474, partial [Globisporangium splendens]
MDAKTFAKWKTATQSDGLETVKAEVLEHYPAVVEKSSEFVPSAIDAETFWMHYIYKASLLAEQEQRGADLLFFVEGAAVTMTLSRLEGVGTLQNGSAKSEHCGRVFPCWEIGLKMRSCGRQHWYHLDHAGALEHVLRWPFDRDDTAVILNDRLHAPDREQVQVLFDLDAGPRKRITLVSRTATWVFTSAASFRFPWLLLFELLSPAKCFIFTPRTVTDDFSQFHPIGALGDRDVSTLVLNS